MNKLIITADGSHTIYVPELDEHYHSVFGAIQESDFIFIQAGFNFCDADPLYIFEVGLGTGLNALLTALHCIEGKRKVFYTAIEKYPLETTMVKLLNYPLLEKAGSKDIFELIHSAQWNEHVNICKNFSLRKIHGDIITDFVEGKYDLIYYDAFGPDKQPEIWCKDVIEKLSSITNKDGILVTYSAKGELKRNLKACGFDVFQIPGPPGKRQITRAIKN